MHVVATSRTTISLAPLLADLFGLFDRFLFVVIKEDQGRAITFNLHILTNHASVV